MGKIYSTPDFRWPYCRNYSELSPDRPLERLTIIDPITGIKRRLVVIDITSNALAQIESDKTLKKILAPVWILFAICIIVLIGTSINYYIKKGRLLNGISIEQTKQSINIWKLP